MLVEKNFTYGKDNLPIRDAYKSLTDYFPTKKTSNAKKISTKAFNELDAKFNILFDFLKK